MSADAARNRLFCATVLVTLLAVDHSAFAQTQQERRWCEGEDHPALVQRIEACSAGIKASRDKGESAAESLTYRGLAYRLKGEIERAIQDYSLAIKADSKLAIAFNNRAVAYDLKGEYDRALQDYEQAIKLKPSPQTYFNRGNVYLAKGQFDHAIDDFNQAIRLAPKFAPAFDNRCWARAVVGIVKQALADCNEALRLRSKNAATLSSRAFVYLKMTQFDAAVSDYDAALALNPNQAFALYGRGLARLKNEDPLGETDIAAAKAMQPEIGQEYSRYGIQGAH
ncbi:MAG TPA: tetratricopeptide repeat protein [Xanthobacteraceae bacterium]|jgi:tetratricopeptide (TPR) repeat protein